MASINYKYSLLLVVIVAASLAGVSGTMLIPPEKIYCMAAPDPVFCATLVRGAKTGIQATARAITIGIAVCKRLQPKIHAFIDTLPKDVPAPLKNTIVDTCNKDYQEVLHNYLAALDYLYSGNIDELTIRMSSLPMESCLRCAAKAAVDSGAIINIQAEMNKYVEYSVLIASTCKT